MKDWMFIFQIQFAHNLSKRVGSRWSKESEVTWLLMHVVEDEAVANDYIITGKFTTMCDIANNYLVVTSLNSLDHPCFESLTYLYG